MQAGSTNTTGRFAPTPSGPLHFGSLVTAVASYCQARSQQGKWLIRIEDVDTPRVVKGSSDNILRTLEAFGFEWDGDILYQSQRFAAYDQALQRLLDAGHIYACACTRKQLHRQPHDNGLLGLIYPGHCRSRNLGVENNSLRLNVQAAGIITFDDIHAGNIRVHLAEQIGDVILYRRDGIHSYHLAVVMDDALQGTGQIVRGTDLLHTTPIHLYLNRLLGFKPAQYLHLPLVRDHHGHKLSKQTGACAIDVEQAGALLVKALKFLGQTVVTDLERQIPADILRYAIAQWDPTCIPQPDQSSSKSGYLRR